jgi:hypothetical protein
MSIEHEHSEPAPKLNTLLLFRCQRQGCLHEEPVDDAETAIRRAVEHDDLVRLHMCPDGGLGCCRLIGAGPGRSWHERTESTP